MTFLEFGLTLLASALGLTALYFYIKAGEMFIDNRILCCKIEAQGDMIDLMMRHVEDEGRQNYFTAYYRGRYNGVQIENFGEIIDEGF